MPLVEKELNEAIAQERERIACRLEEVSSSLAEAVRKDKIRE
jgi:hypothetical protein